MTTPTGPDPAGLSASTHQPENERQCECGHPRSEHLDHPDGCMNGWGPGFDPLGTDGCECEVFIRPGYGPAPQQPPAQEREFTEQDCTCVDFCPESDNPCPWCSRMDIYEPCPVIGFGCGSGGIVKPGDSGHDCCTDAQLLAAAGNTAISTQPSEPVSLPRQQQDTAQQAGDCPFCKIVRGEASATVLGKRGSALVIVPLNPVAEGHVLVLPTAHVTDALDNPEVTAMTMRFAALYAREHYGDCNIITSVGAAATQTVRHLHVHIVPRAEGDGLPLPWTAASPGVQGGDDEAQERLTAVLALHNMTSWIPSHACDDDCDEHDVDCCDTCWDRDENPEPWPCPTVRAAGDDPNDWPHPLVGRGGGL